MYDLPRRPAPGRICGANEGAARRWNVLGLRSLPFHLFLDKETSLRSFIDFVCLDRRPPGCILHELPQAAEPGSHDEERGL